MEKALVKSIILIESISCALGKSTTPLDLLPVSFLDRQRSVCISIHKVPITL